MEPSNSARMIIQQVVSAGPVTGASPHQRWADKECIFTPDRPDFFSSSGFENRLAFRIT